MRSIRAALLVGTISGSAAVFVAMMAVLLILLRSLIIEQFDRSLRETALSLASGFEQIPEGLSLELDEFDMREFHRAERPGYFETWLESGKRIYRSPSLGETDLSRFCGPTGVPAYRWLTLPDGRPGRAIGLAFIPSHDAPDAGSDKDEKVHGDEKVIQDSNVAASAAKASSRRVTLVLARDAAPIHAPWRKFGVLLGAVGGAAVALAAGVLWIVVRSRLRPLERIAGEIGRLDPNDLSARVRLSGAPLEIQPIAERLNGLLSKLEAAFERERSLTADVAHELRTPLAGIRSTIDVALSRPRQESDYREALDQCRAIAIQMQEMVENLLSLARIEAGLVAIEARRISIEERLRAVWSPLEARAASRRLRVEWSIDDALPVSTDPTLLDVVLRNIIQNAVEYADEGGTVAIDAASSAAGLEVSVRNSGSRLDQDAAHQVFQRFWRGDAVRSDAGAHCGAGLALVESVVALLGGSVEVSCRAGGEFKIGVSIPSRAAGAAPDRDAPVEGRPPRGHDQR